LYGEPGYPGVHVNDEHVFHANSNALV